MVLMKTKFLHGVTLKQTAGDVGWGWPFVDAVTMSKVSNIPFNFFLLAVGCHLEAVRLLASNVLFPERQKSILLTSWHAGTVVKQYTPNLAEQSDIEKPIYRSKWAWQAVQDCSGNTKPLHEPSPSSKYWIRLAEKFCQRNISSKATTGQFVRNSFRQYQ